MEWNPASERLDEAEAWRSSVPRKCVGGDATDRNRDDGRSVPGPGSAVSPVAGDGDPQGHPPSLSAQVPRSPPLLALVPSHPSLSAQLLPIGSSFDKNCVDLVAAADSRGGGGNLTYDKLRRLCTQRGYARKASKAALETQLCTMDAIGLAIWWMKLIDRANLSKYVRNEVM